MTRGSRSDRNRAQLAGSILLATVLALTGASTALAQGGGGGPGDGQDSAAEIDVEWHEDNMGFNVTSSKEISNVIVEYCPRDDQRQAHKHEKVFQTSNLKEWEHRENETITDIWVKSGNNHDPTQKQPPAPFDNPGAGEHFENPNADCDEQPCEGPDEIMAFTQGTSILLNWTAVADADNYTLYRSESGGSFEQIAVEEDTEFRDDNVTPEETYTYRVTATIEGEETAYCDQAIATAIPDLGTVFAASMAGLTGLAAYATYRRR